MSIYRRMSNVLSKLYNYGYLSENKRFTTTWRTNIFNYIIDFVKLPDSFFANAN